jgi:hypothetical protein
VLAAATRGISALVARPWCDGFRKTACNMNTRVGYLQIAMTALNADVRGRETTDGPGVYRDPRGPSPSCGRLGDDRRRGDVVR